MIATHDPRDRTQAVTSLAAAADEVHQAMDGTPVMSCRSRTRHTYDGT
jgi:hypothetical protein